jgi:hypothetical protein
MTRRILSLFILLSLFALLLYAAVTKLADFYNFRFGLSESALIGPFAGILAWIIPIGELVIAMLLLLPVTRVAALYTSLITLILFTVYIGGMLVFSAEIPCSCGGVLEKMSWPMHILFNCFFILLNIAGLRLERTKNNSNISDYNSNLTYAKRHL